MTKHTPAPWKVQEPRHFPNRENTHLFIVSNNTLVSIMPELQNDRLNESAANARLIAAAPELLEALKLANKHLEAIASVYGARLDGTNLETTETRRIIAAAILKAEGE